jgi:hypothetical protein
MTVPAGNEAAAVPSDSNDAGLGNPEPTDNSGVQEPQTESMNPAWQPLLDKLPSEFVPMITPQLKEWDTKFNERLQQVHSQYEPYKQFAEQQVPAEALEQAYNLFNLINTNPELVYQQMQEFYGFGGQGQEDPNNPGQQAAEDTFDFNSPDVDITQHPKFQELFENQQALAGFLVNQQEQERLAQAEQAIETELTQVKEKYPNVDELMLFEVATGGRMTLSQAAEQINAQMEAMLAQSRQPAPRVFSANGGLPAAQVPDPRKLNSSGTQDLVAQILAQSQSEG